MILGAAALAWLTEENGIFVHTGGWAGGLNNIVIEDSSAFGPVGAVVLLGVPLLTIGAYFARRVNVRHVALALALPTFLILLALKASYNPWITRFLLVPAALTAPLFGILFRRRAVTAAFVVMAALAVALTLGQNRRKPLESPFGPPWQLTWSESLKPQGGGALFAVLDDYDRLVPAKACVGAVLGPDQPSYLLYGGRLRHRVSYLPVEDPLLEAYRHSVFYVVISAGVNSEGRAGLRAGGLEARQDREGLAPRDLACVRREDRRVLRIRPGAVQLSAVTRRSSRSRSVIAPAEWVDQRSLTLLQRMSMSGWWFSASASPATRFTKAIASRKSPNLNSALERSVNLCPALGRAREQPVDRDVVCDP